MDEKDGYVPSFPAGPNLKNGKTYPFLFIGAEDGAFRDEHAVAIGVGAAVPARHCVMLA